MELTLRSQETLVFFLLCFRYPNDVQITSPFTGIIFMEGRRLGVEGSKKTEAGGPKEGGPRGHYTWPRWAHSFGPRGSIAIDLPSRSFPVT